MYEKRIKEKIKRFYIHLTKGADIVPEIVKGILEQKDIKNITFEYDASDEILILNVQVTPGEEVGIPICRCLTDNVLPFVGKNVPVFATAMYDAKHSLRNEKTIREFKEKMTL